MGSVFCIHFSVMSPKQREKLSGFPVLLTAADFTLLAQQVEMQGFPGSV